jgi:hypothetical protein
VNFAATALSRAWLESHELLERGQWHPVSKSAVERIMLPECTLAVAARVGFIDFVSAA